MRLFRIFFLFSILALMGSSLTGETLWNDSFHGYIAGQAALQDGDVLYIEIDASSTLNLDASSRDSRVLTLESSGSEGGNLFSFLPVVSSRGDRSARSKSEYTLKSRIAARVVAVDERGRLQIRGSKRVAMEGREESIVLTGWTDPRAIAADRTVPFSRLADSQLEVQTLLQPAADVLRPADIQEALAALPAAPAAPAAAAPGPATAAPATAGVAAGTRGAAVGPAGAAGTPSGGYQLTVEKKKELLLRYLNRLVDVLFR